MNPFRCNVKQQLKVEIMKAALSGLVAIVSYLAMFATGIWVLVEFIIYLFKDHVFNWTSLWSFTGAVVLMLISGLLSLVFSVIENKSKPFSPKGKSKFQERLNQMAKDRGMSTKGLK